ncbi:hypothetical protein BDR04DRAFT_1088991 [Suillus decipiens]|nr:hypothetical protein BDR04DRAFT_1088991 [Suillus decipiens]
MGILTSAIPTHKAWREKNKLVLKINNRVMIWVGMVFFALDFHWTNISQANTLDCRVFSRSL